MQHLQACFSPSVYVPVCPVFCHVRMFDSLLFARRFSCALLVCALFELQLPMQVEKGVYEGGFSIWECTWDLLGFLLRADSKEAIRARELVTGGHVLDLGECFRRHAPFVSVSGNFAILACFRAQRVLFKDGVTPTSICTPKHVARTHLLEPVRCKGNLLETSCLFPS